MKKIILSLLVSLLFIPVVNAKDVKNMELGSYVTYNPTSTSYTATAENTGYTSNSTINPSELTSWRVLKINDDGTVDIVSTYVSSSTISFKGKTGYVNFVNELQKAAAAYINTTYASSARSLGFNGQTLVLTDTTMLEKTTVPWTVSTSDNTNEATGGGDTLYLTDINQMNTAGISLKSGTEPGKFSNYFLSSRYYEYTAKSEGISEGWTFDLRIVRFDGNISYLPVYNKVSSSESSQRIRPVVTLKANQSVIGSGTEENPYVFGEETTTTTITNKDSTTDKKDEEVTNPKTGITDLLGLFIVSILALILFINNKKNITNFKEL